MHRHCLVLWKCAVVSVVTCLLLSVSVPRISAADTGSHESSSASTGTCTRGEYVAAYGPCLANATRLRTWVKAAAAHCTEAAATRPPSVYLPCATCPPGMLHSRDDKLSVADCRGCLVGEYLDEAGEAPPKCVSCPPGTAATPALAFRDGFDGLSGDLTALTGLRASRLECPRGGATPCTLVSETGFDFVAHERGGAAGSSSVIVGLRPSHEGATELAVTQSLLNYTFAARSSGWVEVSFALTEMDETLPPASLDELPRARASLIVDGVVHDVRDAAVAFPAATTGVYTVVAPFYHVDADSSPSKGSVERTHTLSWSILATASTPPRTAVTLLSLIVSGDLSGGVVTCAACPAGYACPLGSTQPQPCQPGTYQPASDAQYCRPCVGNTVAPGYGFRTCLPCDYGGEVNGDHTICNHRCTFAYEDVVYDFKAMDRVALNTTVTAAEPSGSALPMTSAEADAAGVDRVYLSLCAAMPVEVSGDTTDQRCIAGLVGLNSSRAAHVCLRTNATVGHHFGGVMHLEAVGSEVRLITTMGSLVKSLDVRTSAAEYVEETWRAVIQLECSKDSSMASSEASGEDGAGVADLLRVAEVSTDSLTLTWRSPHACPLCTNRSFDRVVSLCSADGTFTVSHVRSATAITSCYGGFTPPAPATESCIPCREEDYTLQWQGCDLATGTEIGRHVIQPEHAACTPSEIYQPQDSTRSCVDTPTSKGAARRVSAAVGGFVLLLTVGLVVAALLPERTHEGYQRTRNDDEMELESVRHGQREDGLEAHYNVVGEDGEEGRQPASDSRFSSAAGHLISSLSNALLRVRAVTTTTTSTSTVNANANANAVVSGRSVTPLSEEAHGHDYSTMPTPDRLLSEGDNPPPRPWQASRGRRTQVLFSLGDEDDDDLLPPRSPQ